MILRDKKEMYLLLRRGYLGNTLRTYSPKDLSDLPPSLTVRYAGDSGSYPCYYGIPRERIPGVLTELAEKKLDLDLVIMNESAPDNKLLLQGEIVELDSTFYLTGSYEKTGMRQAMQEAWTEKGIKAKEILRYFATPSSYDMLQELLSLFQGHVIEFGIYDCLLGSFRGHNMVIWEVRLY